MFAICCALIIWEIDEDDHIKYSQTGCTS